MVTIVVLTLAEGDVVISSMLMTSLLLSLWFLAQVMLEVAEASAGSDTADDSWQQHYWMEMNRSTK